MKYVLVETWEAFTVSAGNTIRYRFSKTHLLPLIPTNIITNTQEYVASIKNLQKESIILQKTHLHLLSFLWQGPTTLWWSSKQRLVLEKYPEKYSLSGRVWHIAKANIPPSSEYEEIMYDDTYAKECKNGKRGQNHQEEPWFNFGILPHCC